MTTTDRGRVGTVRGVAATRGADAALPNGRVLTGSTTIGVADAGAGLPVTLSVNPSSIDDAELVNTAVLPGAYTNATVVVNAKGRVVNASSGAGASGAAGGDLNGTYPNPSLDAVITRTTANAEFGMIAGTATYDAYIYVSGNGAPGQFVQILSGGVGEAEIRMVPGAGVDSQIVHVGSGGGDLDITTTLGGNVYVNKATDNVDFTASGLTVARLLHVDAGLDQVGIGTGIPVELLTVAGRLALAETTAPTATVGVGKIYVKSSDGDPYYMDGAGIESPLLGGGSGTFGSAVATFSGGADSVTVTVVDAGVSAGSNIIPTVEMVGRDADEFEMAPVMVCVASKTAGVGFTLLVVSLDGDAEGAYTINYTRD